MAAAEIHTIRELPILMNGAMVRAVLEGRKTVTRRLVKRQPDGHHWERAIPRYAGQWRECRGIRWFEHSIPQNPQPDCEARNRAPYDVGDRLYMRETAFNDLHPSELGLTPSDLPGTWDMACAAAGPVYRADHSAIEAAAIIDGRKWVPSIHMPKAWARIWLEVTAVRIERLQDITEDHAHAEGIDNQMAAAAVGTDSTRGELLPATVHRFAHLWDGLAKTGARWADNPWVWCISFRRIV